jgi:hypothetical protein
MPYNCLFLYYTTSLKKKKVVFKVDVNPAPAKNNPTPTTFICQLTDTIKNPIIVRNQAKVIANFRPKLSAINENIT